MNKITGLKGNSILGLVKRDWQLFLIVLPGVLYFLIFCYGPMYGIIIAFKNFNISQGITGSPWADPIYKYFLQLFKSVYFPRLLSNTFMISIKQLVFSFPLPIIFALLLNELRSAKLKRLAQTTTYLPHFISQVVVVGIMMDFLSTDGGIVNQMVEALGFAKIAFFNKPSWFQGLYVGSGVWQEFGWNSIIYIAALSSINVELYEASDMDGAGRFQKLLHITIPGLAPTMILLLILSMGNMLNIGYEKIILMYNPATYQTADVFSTYIYRKGLLDSQYSFAGAVGLLNSAVNVVILLLSNAISKKATSISLF